MYSRRCDHELFAGGLFLFLILWLAPQHVGCSCGSMGIHVWLVNCGWWGSLRMIHPASLWALLLGAASLVRKGTLSNVEIRGGSRVCLFLSCFLDIFKLGSVLEHPGYLYLDNQVKLHRSAWRLLYPPLRRFPHQSSGLALCQRNGQHVWMHGFRLPRVTCHFRIRQFQQRTSLSPHSYPVS